MISKVYSIYDRAINEYNKPFVCQNDEVAIRDTKIAYSNPALQLIAKDCVLECLGSYDTVSGEFVNNKYRVWDLADLSYEEGK